MVKKLTFVFKLSEVTSADPASYTVVVVYYSVNCSRISLYIIHHTRHSFYFKQPIILLVHHQLCKLQFPDKL